MEAIEALLTRRSIRKFKSEQISDDDLKKVIEAGMYAPSAMGFQSPFILAIQNKEEIEELYQLYIEEAQGVSINSMPFYGAPTVIAVFYSEIAITDFLGTLDASAATTNMLNAANALGLGSVWINRCKEIFSTIEGRALLDKWGAPENLTGVAFVALGYPDCEKPKPKQRRDGYYKIIK